MIIAAMKNKDAKLYTWREQRSGDVPVGTMFAVNKQPKGTHPLSISLKYLWVWMPPAVRRKLERSWCWSGWSGSANGVAWPVWDEEDTELPPANPRFPKALNNEPLLHHGRSWARLPQVQEHTVIIYIYSSFVTGFTNPFISKVTPARTRLERCRKVTGWAPCQVPACRVQVSPLQLCLMSSQEVSQERRALLFQARMLFLFSNRGWQTWLPHPHPVPLPLTFQAHICLYNYASSGGNGT